MYPVRTSVSAQVGTATTGFMILFTALGGTVKYLAVGRLPWRFLLWFGSIGVLGGQTGQRLVKKLIQRTGRPSIMVILLGTIIALAVIIMATMGIVNGVKARDSEIGRDRARSGEIDDKCFYTVALISEGT